MSFGVIIIEEKRGFITKKAFVSATIRPVPSALHGNFQSAAQIVGVTGLVMYSACQRP
jgi:hypothetical protein